jgi:hypothetical protein
MKVKSPDPQPRESGDYKTYVNGVAYGKPYAKIYLDEDETLVLGGITLDDARRLAAAATRVEQELAAAHARMAAPHGRDDFYNGTCQLCGKPEDDGLHADPAVTVTEDEALPDCAGCAHAEAGHRRHPTQAIAGGACLYSGCACTAYALPQDEDPFEVPRALITLDCGCSFTGPVTSVKKVYCDTHGRHEPIASVTPYTANGLQGPAPVVRVLDAPETAAVR